MTTQLEEIVKLRKAFQAEAEKVIGKCTCSVMPDNGELKIWAFPKSAKDAEKLRAAIDASAPDSVLRKRPVEIYVRGPQDDMTPHC